MPRNKMTPEAVDKNTPLRLDVAAELAFPDGSMSVKAFRELRDAGKLTVERIRGKDYTTLADVEEMRKLCRVQAKAPGSESRSATEKKCGSSATGSGTTAQDALSAKVQKAKTASKQRSVDLPSTSATNTIQKPADVIPLKPL